jgi:hypothetical protein
MAAAQSAANVARFSVIGVAVLLVFMVALVDMACRNRIHASIHEAEEAGVAWSD